MSHVVVRALLKASDYSLQANAKTLEVGDIRIANAPLEHINACIGTGLAAGESALTITADGSGSNGCRVRLWKCELQKLADELGLTIRVSHFPPATSRWNKIEHRPFSFINMNWHGRPLVSHEVIVNLIANTATRSGPAVRVELDTHEYAKRVTVCDKSFSTILLVGDEFHGE